MQASERSMLIDHIIDPSTPGNLAIALDTADVVYDVQRRILAAGIKALVERVTAAATGLPLKCIEDSFSNDPLARYAHLRFRRDSWPAGHAVCVEADGGSASKVFVGVMTDGGRIDARLQKMLASFDAGGAGNEHYPWWYWMPAPYSRWTTKESLLAFRSGEAVAALAAQLAAVIAIVDEFSAG